MQAWYDAGAGSYFAPSSTLFAIQLFLFAWVEGRRMQDYNKPGMPLFAIQATDVPIHFCQHCRGRFSLHHH